MSEEKDTQEKQGYTAENASAEADTIFGGEPAQTAEGQPSKSGGMRKNTRLLIICGAVLLVLAGTLTAMLLQKDGGTAENSSETEATQAAISLNGASGAEVVRLEVKGETESYTLVQTAPAEGEKRAVFTIEGYEDVRMNDNLLSTLPYNASALEAEALVEENAKDLERYGLEDPRAEVTAHYADGSEFTFGIGIVSPLDASQTYCLIGGDVYLVRTSLTGNFSFTPADLVSTTVIAEPENKDYPIVQSVRIERKDLEEDLYIEYDYEGQENGNESGSAATHVLVEPVFTYLNLENSLAITNGFFGLTAKEIAALHPEKADFAKYGLDDPFCTATTACDDGNTYVLQIGDSYTTEDGTKCYYTYLEGVNVIYGITEENDAWATVQAKDIFSPLIFDTYVWSLASVDVMARDQKVHFDCEGTDKEDFVVKKDGKTVDTERFRQLYQFILSLYADDLYLDEIPEQEPDAEITLTTQSGHSYTVSFYQKSALQTLVARDGVPTFTIRTSSLDTLAHDLEIFDDMEQAFTLTWQ